MKRIHYIFYIAVLLVLYSCEKVIEIDLDSGEQKMVIEAVILDSAEFSFVKISRTRDYFENNEFEIIFGAQVNISDDQGNDYLLTETEPGFYFHPDIIGSPGVRYDLSIQAEGETITAFSTAPTTLQLDSIEITENPSTFADGEFRVWVHFTDPVDEENFYIIKAYRDGEIEDEIFLLSDDIFNGQSTSFPLFAYGYDSGEEVQVEIFSMEENTFKYFFTIDENNDAAFIGASPGNPESNLEGADVLGYFGAQSYRSETFIIP